MNPSASTPLRSVCGCRVHLTRQLTDGHEHLTLESIEYCTIHKARGYAGGEVPSGVADTSRAAAAFVRTGLRKKEIRVLRALSICPAGLTVEQVAEVSGLRRSTVAPRLSTLARMIPEALCADSGERRSLSTMHTAIVWQITGAGREWLAINAEPLTG